MKELNDKINPGHRGNATYLPKEETGISFPLNCTALLVIDPVNDFLSEGGADWEMTKTTVEMNDVIENLKRVIDATRSYNIPVLFGQWHIRKKITQKSSCIEEAESIDTCLRRRCF
jgi:isochorismate hydrolase